VRDLAVLFLHLLAGRRSMQFHRKAFPEEKWPASRKRLKCDDLEGSSGTLFETLAQSINDWSLDSSLIADLKVTRGT